MHELFCSVCGMRFNARRTDKRYCSSKCQGRAGRLRRLEQTDITKAGGDCRTCGKHFSITPPSTNQRYCSEGCAREAARAQRRAFHRRNPKAQKTYNSRRPFKDSVIARLRRKHADLPSACESCGEGRILEVAHKPEFKRNGAWRIVANTQRHMIYCAKSLPVPDKDDPETWGGQQP